MRLETWKKEDAPFHEIHSFPNILDKVQSQQITTILGSPGSGKTATARHLALQLQISCAFEIVPVDDIKEIKQYGHAKCKQLFILDDVIGVFEFKRKNLANLNKNSESILNVLGKYSKILFTCRKAVYNEAKILFTLKTEYKEFKDLKSFAFAEEFIVDLEDIQNRLNNEDRSKMLKNHCIQNGLSLNPEELSNDPSTVGLMMFPLLCKLYCSESKYWALEKEFFEKPYACILDQMDCLKGHKQIQYASLVLCMFCPNEIAEGSFRKQDCRFMEIKSIVFERCRASGSDTKIRDALNSMINTFTTRTNEGYSLIHDLVYEVLAFHYGNIYQEDMLQYMNSSFVSKKFNVNDILNDSVDLHIKLNREHYPAFAERLVRDLKCMELHDVFMNEALKESCIYDAFIDELKKLSYLDIKTLFFIKQKDTSNIFIRRDKEIKNVWRETKYMYELQRQELLMGETRGEPNIRVISWVITYGSYQLLQFLFDFVSEQNESIRRVMDLEIPGESGNSYISDLPEQARLLTLSCYNDDVEVVKLILKHCDVNCIDNSFGSSSTPLVTACLIGNTPVVDLLIKNGSDCNQRNIWGETPLYAASWAGHGGVIDLLIKNGADCNHCNNLGETPLYAASWAGLGDVVDLLIKYGADCNNCNCLGETPLYAASRTGHPDVVDLLIKGGADCKKSYNVFRIPLDAASKAGHADVVDLLIKGGSDCNQSNNLDETPLYAASEAGHADVVDLLIKGGADCNQSAKKCGTPLYIASRAGHANVVDLLIKGGSDCNQSNNLNETPLYAASEAGHPDVVKLLIKIGAVVNQSNSLDETPLYAATRAGYADVVNLLIKGGADCNHINNKGETPLYAASEAGHGGVVDLLIKGGADCNHMNNKGETPLFAASEAGHGVVVDMLIKNGADCNHIDYYGEIPLCAASRAGHANVVNLLIKSGADCNPIKSSGITPLYAASEAGHADIVDLLIKDGANSNERSIRGNTPLHAASEAGHAGVVDLLIKNGADCNQRNDQGETPLDVASWTDYYEVIYLLEKGDADDNEDYDFFAPPFLQLRYAYLLQHKP